jgi:hypothetical protein
VGACTDGRLHSRRRRRTRKEEDQDQDDDEEEEEEEEEDEDEDEEGYVINDLKDILHLRIFNTQPPNPNA